MLRLFSSKNAFDKLASAASAKSQVDDKKADRYKTEAISNSSVIRWVVNQFEKLEQPDHLVLENDHSNAFACGLTEVSPRCLEVAQFMVGTADMTLSDDPFLVPVHALRFTHHSINADLAFGEDHDNRQESIFKLRNYLCQPVSVACKNCTMVSLCTIL